MRDSTARAGVFLSGFLSAFPRPAAEAIERGRALGFSARTLQRASKQLSVIKEKEGRQRWLWRLSKAGDQKEQGVDLLVNVMVTASHSAQPNARCRAEVIAARLRKLEALRGLKAPIHAQDPRVVRWAEEGLTDPDLREAYELAIYSLGSKGNRTALTVGYLKPFVEKIQADPQEE